MKKHGRACGEREEKFFYRECKKREKKERQKKKRKTFFFHKALPTFKRSFSFFSFCTAPFDLASGNIYARTRSL